MPKPYSVDLREKVIQAVEDGVGITETALRFGVGRKAIYEWKKLKEETGSLEPKTDYQKGHSHSIPDLVIFTEFAKKHQHLNIPQMVIEWAKFQGVTVGRDAMRLSLKKIDFTHKKKHLAIRKQIHKSAKTI